MSNTTRRLAHTRRPTGASFRRMGALTLGRSALAMVLATACGVGISPGTSILTPPVSLPEREEPKVSTTLRVDPTTLQTPAEIDVIIATHIQYTSEPTLDVYFPSQTGSWPVVVVYHGGFGSSSTSMSSLAGAIAQHGVVVFVPNWRSDPTPASELERGAEDAACAIRFARNHAPDYGADPDRLVAVGHSGGGWVGALMTLAVDEFAGDCLVENETGGLEGFVGLEGPYDLIKWLHNHGLSDQGTPAEWARLSPLTYLPSPTLSGAGVEFRMFVGELAEAREMADTFEGALTKAGFTASVTELPGVSHSGIKSGSIEESVEGIVELAHR